MSKSKVDEFLETFSEGELFDLVFSAIFPPLEEEEEKQEQEKKSGKKEKRKSKKIAPNHQKSVKMRWKQRTEDAEEEKEISRGEQFRPILKKTPTPWKEEEEQEEGIGCQCQPTPKKLTSTPMKAEEG